jgi:beta-N-acetylhexosaminidase
MRVLGGLFMRKKLVLIMCIFLLFTAVGCSKVSSKENAVGYNKVSSKEKLDIRGEITKLSLNDSSRIVNILVEGKIEEDTSYDKASVYVGEKTKIYQADTNKELTIGDLKEGLKVEIVFTGPVRESYPVQADAKIINIIK